ncbi:MAG TPA: hypothetical protein VEF05_11550 [Terriglobales bacterium]|nr:hypothetical protein [Terriglobales bacterium]
MTKRSPLIVLDDSEDSPTMDLIDLMGVEPLTRDEYSLPTQGRPRTFSD